MTKDPVRVSDHAVLRYLERAMGFNLQIVRDHIAKVCDGPAAIGAVCVRSEGVRFEITNNTVLTVRPDTGPIPSRVTQERHRNRIERNKDGSQLAG